MKDGINDLLINGVYNNEIDIGDTRFNFFLDATFCKDYKDYEKTRLDENSLYHNHLYYEILVVMQGCIEIVTVGGKVIVEKDMVAFIPKNSLHYTIFNKGCKYHAIGFMISNKKTEEASSRIYDKIESLLLGATLVMMQDELSVLIVNKISKLLDNNYFFSEFAIKALLQQIIYQFLQHFVDNYSVKQDTKNYFIRPNIIYAINQKINDIKDNTTLQEIAKELFISVRQLSRIIKKQYGVSYRERKNELRIESAKKLLVDTDLSLEKIINEHVYFSSVGAFVKIFKEKVGESPTQYRERCKKNK